MSEAPERVWLTHPWQMSLVSKKRTVEYVRADKLEELAANAVSGTNLTPMEQEVDAAKWRATLAEKDREIAVLRGALEEAQAENAALRRVNKALGNMLEPHGGGDVG